MPIKINIFQKGVFSILNYTHYLYKGRLNFLDVTQFACIYHSRSSLQDVRPHALFVMTWM